MALNIDPLKIKCPGGKSVDFRTCHSNHCPGKWSEWSNWSECDVCGKIQYSLRRSQCFDGHCERETSTTTQSDIKTVSIGDKNKIQIKLCPVKNCDSDQCKDGQVYFDHTPCLVSCRDLSNFYKKVNTSVNNFVGLQNLAKNTAGINEKCMDNVYNVYRGGCYCPIGSLLNDNSTCVHPDGSEVVSEDGCTVCNCVSGKLVGCQKKTECESSCKWSDWSDFGPCLGSCGSNGIQWSFRNPLNAEMEQNCVGIFQKSRRCLTDPCPFCVDESGYSEDETEEAMVNRLHKIGEQWMPVDKELYPCHICTCLQNGTIDCTKFCKFQNTGCPTGKVLKNQMDGKCCECVDESIESSSISNIITTVVNYFTKTDESVITVSQEEKQNCTKYGGLVCDELLFSAEIVSMCCCYCGG